MWHHVSDHMTSTCISTSQTPAKRQHPTTYKFDLNVCVHLVVAVVVVVVAALSLSLSLRRGRADAVRGASSRRSKLPNSKASLEPPLVTNSNVINNIYIVHLLYYVILHC